jgi:hypothetical protein
MPSPQRCLIGGLVCLLFAATLFVGWLMQPVLEGVLIRRHVVPEVRQSDTHLARGRDASTTRIQP